jgi:predicted choloylglycine hydrolase
MLRIDVAGSYYELGLAYGRIVSEKELNCWWEPPTEDKLALVKACEREIAVHAPGFLEEVRGVADACRSDYDLVLSNMTVTYWQPACNVVAVSGSQCQSGRTILARNHDWLDEDIEWVTCFRTNPQDGLPSIGFGFSDPGRYGGVNQAGLAISSASIPYYRHRPQPGLRMNVVTRWVLDTCPDTPSAVDYLAHIPHHEAISYLLADKEGRIARVEAAPEGVDVALEDDGMLSAVNCFQAEGMAHLVRVPAKDDSVHRYRKRIAAWYDENKGRIDLHDAQRLCSDHEVGLCDHGEAWSVPGGTIYSWVVELGTGQVHVAHGRPCQNKYQVITLEAS